MDAPGGSPPRGGDSCGDQCFGARSSRNGTIAGVVKDTTDPLVTDAQVTVSCYETNGIDQGEAFGNYSGLLTSPA